MSCSRKIDLGRQCRGRRRIEYQLEHPGVGIIRERTRNAGHAAGVGTNERIGALVLAQEVAVPVTFPDAPAAWIVGPLAGSRIAEIELISGNGRVASELVLAEIVARAEFRDETGAVPLTLTRAGGEETRAIVLTVDMERDETGTGHPRNAPYRGAGHRAL